MKLTTTSLRDLSHRVDSTAWKALNTFEEQMEHWIKAMSPEGTHECTINPACDIGESEDYFLIRFDTPGIRREDLKIELDENHLSISGERKPADDIMQEKVERYYLSETCSGSFLRRFTLPATVTQADVEASYVDGVLTIAVKKSHDPQHATSIQVN
jgi:HSP20 family protein